MSLDDAKLDLLYKKIAYQRSRTTQTTNPFEEQSVSSDPINPANIWTDAKHIPETPEPENVSVSGSIIVAPQNKVTMKPLNISKLAWKAVDENDNDVRNWIPKSYGSGYSVSVHTASQSTEALNELSTGYYFDYSSGVLHFLDSSQTISYNELFLDGWVYTGSFGFGLPNGGASITGISSTGVGSGSIAFFKNEEVITGSQNFIYKGDGSTSTLTLKGDVQVIPSGSNDFSTIYRGDDRGSPSSSIDFFTDRMLLKSFTGQTDGVGEPIYTRFTIKDDQMSYKYGTETIFAAGRETADSIPFVRVGAGIDTLPSASLYVQVDKDRDCVFMANATYDSTGQKIEKFSFANSKDRVFISQPKELIGSSGFTDPYDQMTDPKEIKLAIGFTGFDEQNNFIGDENSTIAIVAKNNSSIKFANTRENMSSQTVQHSIIESENFNVVDSITLQSVNYSDLNIRALDTIRLVPGTRAGRYTSSDPAEVHVSGALKVTEGMTILGPLTVDELIIKTKSVTHLEASGSTKFGDTDDDTHEFKGKTSLNGALSMSGSNSATANSGAPIVKEYTFGLSKICSESKIRIPAINIPPNDYQAILIDSTDFSDVGNGFITYELLIKHGTSQQISKITIARSGTEVTMTQERITNNLSSQGSNSNEFEPVLDELDNTSTEINLKLYRDSAAMAIDTAIFINKSVYKF